MVEELSKIRSFPDLVGSGMFTAPAVRRVLRTLVLAKHRYTVPVLVTAALRNKVHDVEVTVTGTGEVVIHRVITTAHVVADPMDELLCSTCGAVCTVTCSGCHLAAYCNTGCQRIDRKAHRVWCTAAGGLQQCGQGSHALTTTRKLGQVLAQPSTVEATMARHLRKKESSE
jgi:hypothetical protein